MSSIITSQGVALATAVVVSSTALFLAFSHQFSGNPNTFTQSSPPNLRSCLYSGGEKKRDRKQKKKVKFAKNVKQTEGNGEEYRKDYVNKKMAKIERRNCRNQTPPNRIALYNGILRDRVHRIQYTY